MTKLLNTAVVYVGFFTFAGYDKIVVEETKEKAWKRMKKEYFKWRKEYGEHRTWKDAIDYFGYRVYHR